MKITELHLANLRNWTDTSGNKLKSDNFSTALRLYAFLNKNSSASHPLKSLEIQEGLCLSGIGKRQNGDGAGKDADRKIRICFRALAESGFNVASTPNGFFVARTKQEMDHYINSFRSRIKTQQVRLTAMERTQKELPDEAA